MSCGLPGDVSGKGFPDGVETYRTACRLPRNLARPALMFLVHSTLGDADMADTCRAIEKVMEEASQ